jgi:hypothetical protein
LAPVQSQNEPYKTKIKNLPLIRYFDINPPYSNVIQ